MCLAPSISPDGFSFGCRKCWQCKQRKINDWVGRCIAESKTAIATHSLTLTYGRNKDGQTDHHNAAVLTYSDVQKFFKKLRRAGYNVRYFAVGEYGSMKGRAHWHILIFWGSTPPPEIELNKRFEFPYWDNGYSFFEKPTTASIKYVCKYIQKDFDDLGWQGHLAMSKKPPLGADYFIALARNYVEQGLSPRDCFYSFPDVKYKGEKTQFLMSGATKTLFLNEFVAYWKEYYGNDLFPNSELVEDYLDSITPEQLNIQKQPVAGVMFKPHNSQLRSFMKPELVRFDEKKNLFYYDAFAGGGESWYWMLNENGIFTWRALKNPKQNRLQE